MGKALKVTSFLCLAVAILSIVFGIIVMTSGKNSFFVGFAMFNVVKNGTFMGFIGNLFGVATTFASFGFMGFYGFKKESRPALIWSGVVVLMAIISLIMAFMSHKATFGDILITVLPITHLFLVIRNA